MELSSRNLFCKASFVLDHLVAKTNDTTPVLINGFWRSGTTWVQEVLASGIQAKTMFEPLEPNTFLPLHDGQPPESSAYLPLSADVLSVRDLKHLDEAFAGISPKRSQFNYLCRKQLSESLRKKVVIKLVRGHFLLPFFAERYNLPSIIHISRHPMAVAYSMLRAKWEWHIEDVDFRSIYFREADQTLSPEQRDLLGQLYDFSDESPERKVAALWALSERFVYEQPGIDYFKYESLLLDSEQEFDRMATSVGEVITNPIQTDRATAVTESDRKDIDILTRLNSWQTKLPRNQQKEISAVLKDVWPNVTDHWELK